MRSANAGTRVDSAPTCTASAIAQHALGALGGVSADHLDERLVRHEGVLVARADHHESAVRGRCRAELGSQAGLADAWLPGNRDDAPFAAARPRATRRRAPRAAPHGRRGGRAQPGVRPAAADAGVGAGSARISSTSSRVAADGARRSSSARRSRRRSYAVIAAPRSPACCQAADQFAPERLRQWIQRDEAVAEADRVLQAALALGARRRVGQAARQPIAQFVALLQDPIVVEPGKQLGRAALERLLRLAGEQQPLDLIEIGANLRRQRDAAIALPSQHERAGWSDRGANLRQRGPQAHAGAVLADVRPQSSGQLAAAVDASLDREDREEQPGLAAERRQAGVRAVDLQSQVAQEVQPHHCGASLRPPG